MLPLTREGSFSYYSAACQLYTKLGQHLELYWKEMLDLGVFHSGLKNVKHHLIACRGVWTVTTTLEMRQ